MDRIKALERLESEGARPLELFFAKRILKKSFNELRSSFLVRLMAASRLGHFFIEEKTHPDLPDTILAQASKNAKAPILYEGNRYYLNKNWMSERFLSERVHALMEKPPLTICDERLFVEKVGRSSLLKEQKEAVLTALKTSFSILSGGPGTGKTFTVAYFVRTLIECATKPLTIYLTAPTGKAAFHLDSAVGKGDGCVEAMTLHRLLRLAPGKKRRKGKIDADLILIDEASMLDVSLFAKTLDAIGEKTRLILIGDPDQLPPVDTKSLFKALSSLFGSHLKRSMRVEKKDLYEIGDQINQGALPETLPILTQNFDSSLFQILKEKLPPVFFDFKPDPQESLKQLERFRILCALRQGPFGTDALNREILNLLKKDFRKNTWWVFPIMITKNSPHLDLYNGTSGVLIGFAEDGIYFQHAKAYFPKEIAHKELPPFELSFCLSIHKSQGSEFDSVLALFPPSSQNFGKEALYTAVTRAKKKLEVIGEKATFLEMISKKEEPLSFHCK